MCCKGIGHLCLRTSSITIIVENASHGLSQFIKHMIAFAQLSITHWFACMDALGNRIGAEGAAALVAGLKELQKLEKLDLGGECSMCIIAR